MAFGLPRRDIFFDAFRQYTGQSYLMLTDERLPIRIMPTPEPAEFNIYTTEVNDCRELGSTKPPFQRPVGYMCHGYTKNPVKVPYAGQKMFFWMTNSHSSIFSGQSVMRIYDKPVLDLISNPWNYLNDLFDLVDLKVWEWSNLNLLSLNQNKYDPFFKNVLLEGITKSRGNDFSLPVSISQHILRLIPGSSEDENAIFNSGLIHENEQGQIVISEALFITLMDAIHTARPMRTTFDSNNILRVA